MKNPRNSSHSEVCGSTVFDPEAQTRREFAEVRGIWPSLLGVPQGEMVNEIWCREFNPY